MKLLPISVSFLHGVSFWDLWGDDPISPGRHRHEFSIQAEGIWSLEFAQWHGCLERRAREPGCKKSVTCGFSLGGRKTTVIQGFWKMLC